jgi:hypothetical protein
MNTFYFEIVKHPLLSRQLFKAGIFAVFVLAVVSLAPTAIAQVAIGARPGMISFTVGDVYIDGKSVQVANQIFPFLDKGQWLQTNRGLVELMLASDIFLRLDQGGALRMVRGSRGDAQIELRKGAAIVEVVKIAKGDKIQIQCAGSNTELKSKGVYRFDVDPAKLRVYGGTAEVSSATGDIIAVGGKAVALANALAISKFSVKSSDSLHQWAAGRSFNLFISNSEALATQTHWELSYSGQSRNTDFHIRLYAPEIAKEYARRHSYDQQAEAIYRANRERWQLQDEMETRNRQEQLRQEQLQQQQQQNKRP